MSISHLFLAVFVVVIWGINFIFVKLSLEEISPLFLCGIRFLMASTPAIFFIKPPQIPFRIVALYGLITFGLQFSLLFMGMYVGMTPGMASLIMQVQIFFSMFFAVIFLGERPGIWQIFGALISFTGIILVAKHFDQTISLLGFLCILGAAASWGVGNLITKKVPRINMFALVVWGSLIACIPMLIISVLIEGPDRIVESYQHLTWRGMSGVLYIVYGSTLTGYGTWNWLVSRYPVGTIVPFTLLVPVVGIMSSVIVLGEPFFLWKLWAGLLVIGGLCVNLFGGKLFMPKVQAEAG